MDQAMKDTFIAQLPKKPYSSDDLTYGLQIRKSSEAIKKRYIQHNPPTQLVWLVFDCDKPNTYESLVHQINLPTPNFEVFNPKNKHSHLFYGFKTPIVTADAARQKPLRYLAAIQHSLCKLLEADENYVGLVSKNPLHLHWETVQRRVDLWTMGEIADWLELPLELPKKVVANGLGRNCTIFDTVRYWAYREVLKFRLASNQQAFAKAVKQACMQINIGFATPLLETEIDQIAKSISKWVWTKYQKKLNCASWQQYIDDTHTPEIQSKRGKKSGESRRAKIQDSIAMVQELYDAALTPDEICEMYSISKRTFWNWMKVQLDE